VEKKETFIKNQKKEAQKVKTILDFLHNFFPRANPPISLSLYDEFCKKPINKSDNCHVSKYLA